MRVNIEEYMGMHVWDLVIVCDAIDWTLLLSRCFSFGSVSRTKLTYASESVYDIVPIVSSVEFSLNYLDLYTLWQIYHQCKSKLWTLNLTEPHKNVWPELGLLLIPRRFGKCWKLNWITLRGIRTNSHYQGLFEFIYDKP